MKFQSKTAQDSANLGRRASDLGPQNVYEPVILSGATASQCEAVAESKDPYKLQKCLRTDRAQEVPNATAFVESVGVLRLRGPIRSANQSAALRMTKGEVRGLTPEV